jgi:hypothetical protein
MNLKLGDRVKDKITGFTGIIVCRMDWLYGCVRYVVQPEHLFEGRPVANESFDEEQLELVAPDAHIDLEDKTTGGDRDFVANRR